MEPYSLRRCVNLEVWKAEMAHINPENKYVVLAVIKNILENTIETAQQDAPEDETNEDL